MNVKEVLASARDQYRDEPWLRNWRVVPSRGLLGRRRIDPGLTDIARHASCLAQEFHLEPFEERTMIVQRAAEFYSELTASVEQFQMLLYVASIVGPWNCALYRYTQFGPATTHPSSFGNFGVRSVRSVAFVEELAMRSNKTDLDSLPANETADLLRYVETSIRQMEQSRTQAELETELLLLSRAYRAARGLALALAPAMTMAFARQASATLAEAAARFPQIQEIDESDYTSEMRTLEFRGFEGWSSQRPAGW